MEKEKEYALATAADLNPLLEAIGDTPIVMLGEASHGTHEYYTWRTALSKRLIEEKGFSFIAVEGDWPDCYRLNRYIKHYPNTEPDAKEVLRHFNRWPTWMWANWEIVALAEWLREYNAPLGALHRIGFYGLDVYSLWESLEAIARYLQKEDPGTAKQVQKVLQCFEPYGEELRAYAQSSLFSQDCENEVVRMLSDIRQKTNMYDHDREAALNTEQNAVIVKNAETYYRSMFGPGNMSWNIRDQHMMETLDRLIQFHGRDKKAIVWEHNTHIGDARATDMRRSGMVNIGQLAREKYGSKNVFLVGFGSYQGTVMAAEAWGAPMQEMEVPAARTGSVEELLHQREKSNRFFIFDGGPGFDDALPHRAIGVVYDPGRERFGNYVPSFMSLRYNAFIFLDETTALHPLHIKPDGHQMPESFPFGL